MLIRSTRLTAIANAVRNRFYGSSLNLRFDNTSELDPRVTFSRTSNATQFDSAGNLVYAPHNLLTFSEQFDNAAFTKSNATITANSTVAPNSSTTADKLVEDTATGLHSVGQIYAFTTGLTYTASAYVKKGERTLCRFGGGNTNVWAAGVVFDLVAGTVTSSPAGSGTITPVGNDWYRITATGVAVATLSTNVTVLLVSTGTTISYTGDGVSGLFVWGAQLNIGTLQPYYPTTVKNALGYSQEFDNAAWTKAAATVTANATAAPDGSVTADKLVETTATSTHAIVQSFAVTSGTAYTLSVFAKNPERFLTVTLSPNATFGGTGAGVFFDLSNGTVRSSFGTVTPRIDEMGGGWYRCSISAVATATGTANATLALSLSGTSQTYTGDGTSGIFIWGAQLSDSASLDPYVYNPVAAPTAAAYYGPRFDYDPATLAARGLLIEEQRTNSIRNNTMQGAVAGTPGTLPTNWVNIASAGLTLQVVGTGVQHGINYIDIKYSGTTTDANNVAISFDGATSIAASTGQVWTGSAYVALVGGNFTNISSSVFRVIERTGAGAFVGQTDASIATATSSLLNRFASTRTLGATAGFVQYGFLLTIASGVVVDITLRIGLPQLELGAFATSVIPTTTAAATRTADVATMVGANFSNWFNVNEGTMFAEWAVPVLGVDNNIFSVNDGTTNNRYQHYLAVASALLVRTSAAGVAANNTFNNYASVGTGTPEKSAFAYGSGTTSGSLNGGAVSTTTQTLPTSLTLLGIGGLGYTAPEAAKYIRRIAYFPRRLANAELQGVTL